MRGCPYGFASISDRALGRYLNRRWRHTGSWWREERTACPGSAPSSPSTRSSCKVGHLPDFEYRLWVGLLTESDDAGRLVCDADQLKALIFPFSPVNRPQTLDGLVALGRAGLIKRYYVAKTWYAHFPFWRDRRRSTTRRSPRTGWYRSSSTTRMGARCRRRRCGTDGGRRPRPWAHTGLPFHDLRRSGVRNMIRAGMTEPVRCRSQDISARRSSGGSIRYGTPRPSTEAAAERGEVILGGCQVGPGDPTHDCRACGQSFGSGPTTRPYKAGTKVKGAPPPAASRMLGDHRRDWRRASNFALKPPGSRHNRV
jgi:hypothetical protein